MIETDYPHDETDACIDSEYIYNQINWSAVTFGPGDRVKGLVDHIKKELKKIQDDPTDLMEWVDVVILAFDGAWRAGHSPEQIIQALHEKQEKNRKRKWPDWRLAAEGQAIEHIREDDEPEDHKTPSNPSGSVQQCGSRALHPPHEWQAEFGAYFDVYCPGNDGKTP